MEQTEQSPTRELNKFARVLGIIVAILAGLPTLIGWLSRPEGSTYLPFHMSLDDHMVYAAWMRQAMEGSFLFDNRFTVVDQPGLTINLYFLVLGWIATFLGITLTLTLVRVALSYALCVFLARFISLLGLDKQTSKFALVLSVFGGGLAWVSWQTFGDKIESAPEWFSSLLSGMQPIDNWQPEGFLFPSMLTNGLFLAAACLILITLRSIIECRDSWKPVLPGAVSFFLLMNIHSYDVLLIAMVLVAFLASCVYNKQLTKAWLTRSSVICSAAIPSALWFLYVMQKDPVFQSRAATPTYSSQPFVLLFGLLPLLFLSASGILTHCKDLARKQMYCSIFLVCPIGVAVLWPVEGGYELLAPITWGILFLLSACLVVSVSFKTVAQNLIWSWACISLIAPYFPSLFQRKLTMLIALPWGILAAIGLVSHTKNIKKPIGPLLQSSFVIIACLSSLLWFTRDVALARGGVSRTLVHNLYLEDDEVAILNILNKDAYGKNVLNIPGIMNPNIGQPAYLSDIGPTLSGLAGVHTFAGHWSETPAYNDLRNAATMFFIEPWPLERRIQFLKDHKIDYVVAPMQNAFPSIPLQDFAGIGEIVYAGNRLILFRVVK